MKLEKIIYFIVEFAVVFLIFSVADYFEFNMTERIIFYVAALSVLVAISVVIDKISDRIARNKLISSNDETDTKGKL